MKTRVIPNEVRDLSKKHGLCKIRHVIRAPSVRSLAVLGMAVWFAWLLLPKPPLLDGISFSQCVRDRNGKLLRVTLSADQKFRIWTPLEEISPDLIEATLRYEDKYYAHHPGVIRSHLPAAWRTSFVFIERLRAGRPSRCNWRAFAFTFIPERFLE